MSIGAKNQSPKPGVCGPSSAPVGLLLVIPNPKLKLLDQIKEVMRLCCSPPSCFLSAGGLRKEEGGEMFGGHCYPGKARAAHGKGFATFDGIISRQF